MKKIIIQATIIVLFFLGVWFTLKQIKWLDLFKVEDITYKTEQKLGELFWEIYKNTEVEITSNHIVSAVDSLVVCICKANNIDKDKLKIHIVKNNEINAFTFPDRHLVVNSNLILNSDYQEELLGVICHEIAHIELNHVMNKLIKEIGLSVLISMSTGNVGTEVLKETVKILSSTAFDRNTEKEADMKAVDYLLKANLNPEYFAGFLKRLSVKEKQESKYLVWISTHPDSEERAKYISTSIKNKKYRYKQVLSIDKWFKLKEDLRK